MRYLLKLLSGLSSAIIDIVFRQKTSFEYGMSPWGPQVHYPLGKRLWADSC